MSTIFHGYRVKKGEFWPVAMQIRAFYQQSMKSLLKDVDEVAREVIGNPDKKKELLGDVTLTGKKVNDLFYDHMGCELQVFDTGKNFYFRVLESGYLFHNSVTKQGWELEPYSVDTRTEPEEGEERRLRFVMERLDPMITEGRYFLFGLLTREDIGRIRFDWYMEVMTRVHELQEETE